MGYDHVSRDSIKSLKIMKIRKIVIPSFIPANILNDKTLNNCYIPNIIDICTRHCSDMKLIPNLLVMEGM